MTGITLLRIPLPADAPVKFLDLFGKPSARHVKNVRSPAERTTEEREATARKIDAIESEITAELEAQTQPAASSDPAQRLEQRIQEASILYASRQPKAAENLLLDAASQPTKTDRETVAWMMLLELAAFDQNQHRFEELSLRYAERFETSPPQWRAPSASASQAPTPTLAFRGKLLNNSGPALAQFEQMSQGQPEFIIDLRGITAIDGTGCGALLRLFKRWEAQRKQVSIMPSPSLLALLHDEMRQEGKPDDDSAWRLLLELLRISGDECAYEDACVAYSLAFELSPPAPLSCKAAPLQNTRDLSLPAEIASPVEELIDSLRAASEGGAVITLDCRQLRLVEFNAAAALLEGIAGLAKGKTVEWRDIPYLVSTLLQLIGGEGKLRISNRQP